MQTRVGRASQGSIGSGWSDADDADTAGREAVHAALGERSTGSADLVIVFAHIELDPVALLDAVTDAAAPARVVACSTAAPFSTGAGPARCVAIHLQAGDLRFGVGWADVRTGGLQAATRAAVTEARDEVAHHGRHGAVILLSDGTTGDQREVVWGAYDVGGASVPLVGGAVGSGSRPHDSWLAADGMLLRPGIVAVWVASSSPLGVAVDHGWQPLGRPMQVTGATEDEILELDGRPAAEVYFEARSRLPPEHHELGLPSLLLPIGVPTDDGVYEVRAFVTREGDGVRLRGHVHEQAIVRLMGAQTHHLVEGAGRAIATAIARLERPLRGALVFSCNVRYDLLQDQIGQEIAAMGQQMGDAVAAGFFTHGEFAKLPGSQGSHSASVAVLAL